jgi:hypothetical protein
MKHFSIAAAAVAMLLPSAVSAQAKPKLVGSFTDWFVYTEGAGATKVCYTLSMPKESAPGNVNRDQPSFLVSTWPAQKKKDEPSFVPGYAYKDGATVQAEVGGAKITFMTDNDGNKGGAWVKEAADERRLLDAMRRGTSMTITGTSSRGTLTRDTFSLSGISMALDKVAASCK